VEGTDDSEAAALAGAEVEDRYQRALVTALVARALARVRA